MEELTKYYVEQISNLKMEKMETEQLIEELKEDYTDLLGSLPKGYKVYFNI